MMNSLIQAFKLYANTKPCPTGLGFQKKYTTLKRFGKSY
jgi:hypothetical protein